MDTGCKYYSYSNSPIGMLKLEATDDALTALHFCEDMSESKSQNSEKIPVLTSTCKQLKEYFKGKRESFDLPVQPSGTSFENSVWNEIANIPYGTTVTYGQLAEKLGDIKKVRAVGRANGRNPLPIIMPCHRVIGVNNKLTGYAGGIERKRWLLQHEGALLL